MVQFNLIPAHSTGWRAGTALLVASLLLGACGPASSVNGAIGGEPFGEVRSAFFMTSADSLYELQLVLTTYSEGCGSYSAYFQGGAAPAEDENALFIRLLLFDAPVVQDYEIVANDAAYDNGIEYGHAWFRTVAEGAWTSASDASATAGTFSLETLSDSELTGSFSLTLNTGDTLSGAMVAEYCAIHDF